MRIETKYFGELDISREDIIHFPNGIPGFIEEKEFVILNFEKNGLFQVLQSTNGINPSFVVIDPFLFVKNYQLEIDDTTVEQLEINNKEDVLALAIVTVKDPLTSSTANLQAPIIINQSKKIAKQYITKNKVYTTRETVFKQTSTEKEG
ncbi:flagellar assembly protein FliW [Gracilibacillus xinjiangensis]|uniref:Flagellar assembly factor FliW n=1 Tax=Gracilibacillus xinjiangensis TaxID=1193282 RepID=A0ABV8WW69_9BACI